MAFQAMIEESIAGEVIVNADQVRRAGRALQHCQVGGIDTSLEEALMERMVRTDMPTKQIQR
ncbi:hypothetical protein DNR46_28340 [Mesorhizobium japonicum]|uniref:Uncharacterized protein n=1 Tax=Mesorhizobium japonicum TaxID=2066070 RepID=A0A3M9X2S0_9HYPH|nr:hypothetical protein DNR46_28340 [Mesorhizobium japonicum]